MNIKRYQQIKEHPSIDQNNLEKNRENIKFNLRENNDEILKNHFKKGVFKEYIISKITDEELSFDEINDLKFQLLKTEWIIIPTQFSIYKILYNLFLENILLPDYVEWWEKEDIFKELDTILWNVQWRMKKILEKMNNYWFFNINIWPAEEIQNELDWFGWQWWFIEHRSFDIWWVFWSLNIWESNNPNWYYHFEIPVRLPNWKKQKVWEKEEYEKNIEPEKIEKILDKYFNKWKWWKRNILAWKKIFKWMEDFFITVEKKINKDWKFDLSDFANYYVINIQNEKIQYLSDEQYEVDEIVLYLKQYFKIANLLINEIWKISWIDHKTRFINFSTQTIYNYWTEEDWDNISKKILEKFWKMLVEIKEPVKLSDVWWQKKAKKEIEKIIKSIKYEAIMKSWWAKTTSWIIFEGPPWTWKTLLARVVASEVDWLFYNIKLTDIASSAYINEWANNLKELFTFLKHKAKKTKKKIIVNLDELEALFKRREWKNQSWEDTKIVNTFLSEMWWFNDIWNIIFIWTTNLKENLDPAVVRSWRLSTSVRVDLPDEEARKQIFEIHLNKAKKSSEKIQKIVNWIDFDLIAKKSEGLSWADIEEVIRSIIEEKAHEEIENWKVSQITTDNFIKKINEFVEKSDNSKKILWKINKDILSEKLNDKENWIFYREALVQILWWKIAKELDEWILKWKIKMSEIEDILTDNLWNLNKMWFK